MPRKLGGWAAIPIALAWGACLACARQPQSEEAPAPAVSAVASAAATTPKQSASGERRRWRGHTRGPAGALLANLRALQLSAQQEAAISAIEADLRAGSDPWRLRGELAQALAAGIRAGKLDRAKLEPQLKTTRNAASEEHARQAKALNTLHATLDGQQRKVLVNVTRGLQRHRFANSSFGAKAPDSPQDPNSRRAKRELERMSTDLELDAQQREKAEKIIAASPNLGESLRGPQLSSALLEAFEKPTFDATKLELGGEEAFNQRLDYLTKLTAMLKPEQRDKLASSLIDRGDFDHRRKPHAGKAPEAEPDDEAPHGDPPEPGPH